MTFDGALIVRVKFVLLWVICLSFYVDQNKTVRFVLL